MDSGNVLQSEWTEHSLAPQTTGWGGKEKKKKKKRVGKNLRLLGVTEKKSEKGLVGRRRRKSRVV